jgi:hypothetical protein
MSLASAFTRAALRDPSLREWAQERKRQREELHAWQEAERAKQREKFKPVPDHRMIALHARIEGLDLPADIVSQFKALTSGAKFAAVEACGEHLAEALPLYLSALLSYTWDLYCWSKERPEWFESEGQRQVEIILNAIDDRIMPNLRRLRRKNSARKDRFAELHAMFAPKESEDA